MNFKLLLLAALAAVFPIAAGAAVPSVVTLDGRLLTAASGPVSDGEYALTFALYASQDATATVWTEHVAKVAVKGGTFSHELGATKALGQGVLAAPQGLWLAVTVGSEPELPRTPLRSVLYARRAELAEGLQCAGCVDATMLGPQVLAGYAKTVDLSGYVKVSELSDYVKASALAKVAGTGQYGDLLGLPVLAKVGAVCGSGLVVKGIKADGALECGAVTIAGGKCAVGEVVVEVKADGGVVCGKAAVVGGKCEPGKVVTEVKADGGVVCADGFAASLQSGVGGFNVGSVGAWVPTVPKFKRLRPGGNGLVCGITLSGQALCWAQNDTFVDSGPSRDKLHYPRCRITLEGIADCASGYLQNTPKVALTEFAPAFSPNYLLCAAAEAGGWHCWGISSDGSGFKQIPPTGPIEWEQPVVGTNAACGIDPSGTVSCVGYLEKPAPKVAMLSIGVHGHTFFGVTVGGGIVVWGRIPMKDALTPLALPSGSGYVQAAATETGICGLSGAGKAVCTGSAAMLSDIGEMSTYTFTWIGLGGGGNLGGYYKNALLGIESDGRSIVVNGLRVGSMPGKVKQILPSFDSRCCVLDELGVARCFYAADRLVQSPPAGLL